MIRSDEQRQQLQKAVKGYTFPAVAFDFDRRTPVGFDSMRDLEQYVSRDLRANSTESVKNGLANVLYWGYARTGYRDRRVRRFREEVRNEQLSRVVEILKHPDFISPRHLREIGLPEFSGMSFLSKILMFAKPTEFVVLDRKLAKPREAATRNIFWGLPGRANATSISVTARSLGFYAGWCRVCQQIAREDFPSAGFRAVDIERGFFTLIDAGLSDIAASILNYESAAAKRELEELSLIPTLKKELLKMSSSQHREVLDFITGMTFKTEIAAIA